MSVLLDALLPRFFPDLAFKCVPHEGKSDLERSIRSKLKAWRIPDDRFVILRDTDGKNCKVLKSQISELCASQGRPETLVRLACHELEAWYLGDLRALAEAYTDPSLCRLKDRSAFRDPDEIVRPAQELVNRLPSFQKIDAARKMAQVLSREENRSKSFNALIDGIAKITST